MKLPDGQILEIFILPFSKFFLEKVYLFAEEYRKEDIVEQTVNIHDCYIEYNTTKEWLETIDVMSTLFCIFCIFLTVMEIFNIFIRFNFLRTCIFYS